MPSLFYIDESGFTNISDLSYILPRMGLVKKDSGLFPWDSVCIFSVDR